MSDIPKLLAKAQIIFNAWVRKRDADLGCISCGAAIDHAGHYLSQGHYSALRFTEVNVNGQCIKCNTYLHGNLINYRKGLVRKYGAEVVERLESNTERRVAHKWDRLELEAIIQKYKNEKKSNKSKGGNDNNS